MEITELKRNNHCKKYNFFKVKLIDGTFIIKVHMERAYPVWLVLKYPVKSFLRNIQFAYDLGEFLLYKSGMRGAKGTYNGDDMFKHIVIKKV